jgi:hypothetical protein
MDAPSEILTLYSALAVFISIGLGSWVGGFMFRGFNRDCISSVRALGRPVLVALALAAAGCKPPPEAAEPTAVAAGEWREFEGSWNATGSRRSIPLGPNRRGSIIDLRGSMLLAGAARPGVGFHSEVIALVDSDTGLTGRSVWTDEKGEQVFSELKGEGTAAKNRIVGTILGGTGRYAGVTGTYEFTWQFVIEAEDGSIQGSAVGLKGRFRTGQPGEGGAKP